MHKQFVSSFNIFISRIYRVTVVCMMALLLKRDLFVLLHHLLLYIRRYMTHFDRGIPRSAELKFIFIEIILWLEGVFPLMAVLGQSTQ